MRKDILGLYEKYHSSRADERLGMFSALGQHFPIRRVLYPGSFVHATPSFVFPDVTYVDMESRARLFFTSPAARKLVSERKIYTQEAQIQFHHQDYAKPLPEEDASFDLLISQYAGFVSQRCKRYLKIGGWLAANNSHGDASMAHWDDDYAFVAALYRRAERFRFEAEGLDRFFVPKKEINVTREYLEKTQRGIGYQHSAFAYIFVRTA